VIVLVLVMVMVNVLGMEDRSGSVSLVGKSTGSRVVNGNERFVVMEFYSGSDSVGGRGSQSEKLGVLRNRIQLETHLSSLTLSILSGLSAYNPSPISNPRINSVRRLAG
jgi:hypothetical protein